MNTDTKESDHEVIAKFHGWRMAHGSEIFVNPEDAERFTVILDPRGERHWIERNDEAAKRFAKECSLRYRTRDEIIEVAEKLPASAQELFAKEVVELVGAAKHGDYALIAAAPGDLREALATVIRMLDVPVPGGEQ